MNILFVCFFSISFRVISSSDSSIWTLTESNFTEHLNLQPDLMVLFYSDSSPDYQKFISHYIRASLKLLKNDPPIHIAQVNADTNPNLVSQFDVKSIPFLKYFINQLPIDYNSYKNEDALVPWILRKVNSTIISIENAEEFEKFRINNPVVVTFFYLETGTVNIKVLDRASKIVEVVPFVVTSNAEIATKYKVSKNTLLIMRGFAKNLKFFGRFIDNEIVNFVNENRLPLILPFNEEIVDLVFKKSNPGLFFFSSSLEQHKADFEKISVEYKGLLYVVYADLQAPDNTKLSEFLGLTPESQPTCVIIDTRGGPMMKYRHQGTFDLEGITNFVEDWKNKQLEPYIKSAPVPKHDYENFVRVLVGKNFEEVVLDTSKNVLVEFYAPWNENCRSFEPIYEKLAKMLRNDQEVVVAKIDMTLNEARGANIKGYPTVKLYPKHNKQSPIDYQGDVTPEAMATFILQNSQFLEGKKKSDL